MQRCVAKDQARMNQLIVGVGLERVRWMCKAGTKQNPIAQRLQSYKRFVIEQDRGHNCTKVLRVTIRLSLEQMLPIFAFGQGLI